MDYITNWRYGMIEKGDLFRMHGTETLVEVVRTYNHRDIDPDCPESVAIIGMIETVVLSGDGIGKKLRFRQKGFWKRFEKLEEK
tara:strand:- start:11 stop:262 length:252 start_codon:yes stop_codon:yes gene_type:complete